MVAGNLQNNSKSYYVSNGILCIIGYVANKAISFFMIPVLTHLMSTVDYGKVNTYIAWVSILAYIMGLALEYSIRTAFVDHRDKFDKHVSAICSLSLLNLLLTGNVAFFINKFILCQGEDLIFLLCILHAYVHSIINYFNIKYTMLEQYRKRLALLLIPNLLSAVLSVILIENFSEYKFMGRIWGYAYIFIPLGTIMILNQYRKNFCFYDKKLWRYGLAVSMPMVLHGLSTVVLSSSDRIIITSFRGESETGIYSLVYNLIMVVVAIFNALENVWIPWFTKKMQRNDYVEINRMAIYYLQLVTAIVCCLLFISPEIITVMAPNEYKSGRELLVPLICSSLFIFLYSLSVNVEIYYKKTKNVAINTACIAVFNILFDFIFIERYGMTAAAYITFISYVLSFLGHYVCARKLNPALFPIKNYILHLIWIIAICIVSIVFMENWIIRWIMAVLIGSIYIVYVYLRVFRK